MQVKTFEAACSFCGYDPEKVLPDVTAFPPHMQNALLSYAKLLIITEAINEKHLFDWNSYSERKYFPWFDLEKDEQVNPSGFRFLVTFYAYTRTAGGSRLCYRNAQDAEFAAVTFLDLWKAMMVQA